MNAKTITKTDFLAAVHTKQAILPAISALRKIDSRVLAGNSYSAKKISQAVSVLEMHIKDCDKLFAQAEADLQAVGGQAFVGRVASRLLAIDGEVNLHSRSAELLIQGHNHKVNSLKHDGFTQSQIDQIEPHPQQQLDDHAAAIEALKAEKEKLHAFLSSAPVYEMHHLVGTSYGGGLNQAEVA
ncbi:hypothetical protein QLH52_11980 [Methylomonas sp. OY6]|uniref:Uncharacterized protein n=1 Tax=Methylomonas defluvii TaxID=3045149 RepID=A0ABU4UF85_9GAMM|nr:MULTISPECIES: hypothetical protein [unclassified Methylomonas]MDX8128004.1 hypothetical protein [Methylomonas sp. OY6]PKD39565.1 hypothetical protein CWO84_14780 [Methylomonas sp. Kb3]